MNQTDIDSLVLAVLEIKPRGEFDNWLDLGTSRDLLFALRSAYRFPPFHIADLNSYDLKTSHFDFVTSFGMVNQTLRPYRLIEKIERGVKENGEVLVGFLNPGHYSKWFSEDRSHKLKSSDLKNLIDNYRLRTQFVQKGRWIIAYARALPKVKTPTVF